MGGIVGRVFREFAVTIAVAIVVSGFVSLTLTPMLCARVLKAHDETRRPNIVLRVFERIFDSWLRGYEWALDRVLARKAMMLVVTFATLAGTVALYFVVLKDRKERDTAPVVIARLRQKATLVPGMQAFFQSVQNLNIGGRPSKSQYQYTLQSGDTESLYRLAPEMRDRIAQVP